jgi:DNA-directed RNA polymerase II subunit RPB2
MDDKVLWKIIESYFENNPQCLVRHHTESYNDFFKNGVFQIFKEKNPVKIQTNYDATIGDFRNQCFLYFGGKDGTRIYYGKPVIYDDENSHYMFPNEARLRNMTYGMTIHYDVEVEIIDVLEKGQAPAVVDTENILRGGDGFGAVEFQEDEYGIPLRKGGEKMSEEKIRLEQKNFIDRVEQDGGAPKAVKRRVNKKTAHLTPSQTAFLREATEKSMVEANRQRRTIILEKIYLGKFPVMIQSDFCILSGLPRETRYNMGECMNDIGGYFIIDGKEKTVIPQEKFGDNMLYIRKSGDDTYLYSAEIRSVSENVSKPIRTLSVKIVAPTGRFTFKNIVVSVPNIRKPVPLFILFRALGVLSDKEIIKTCLLDMKKYESMVDLFIPSVHDAASVMSQREALHYLAILTKGKTVANALEILADYLFPHIGEMNFLEKAYYLGYMTFRLLSVYTGLELPTDRDNYKYKRIELVGSLMHDLFREYYNIQHKQIHRVFEEKIVRGEAIYSSNLYALIDQNFKEAFGQRAVEEGFRKAFKGNWGAQTHTKRVGIVQDLNRLSFNSALSHLRKTNLPMDASVKLVGPRLLHTTQWGLYDPIDTPDGGNIGLHKHLSISAYITKGISREPLIEWLRENIEMKLIVDCGTDLLSNMSKVILNGYWAGSIAEPFRALERMKLYRRNALLPIYMSMSFDIKQNTLFLYTDAGRICRPLFYRDSHTDKMSYDGAGIMEKLIEGEFTWSDLITGWNKKKVTGFDPNQYGMYDLSELYEGITTQRNPAKVQRFIDYKCIIDYMDSSEMETALIAFNPEELKADLRKKYTHMEIHESFILGMMGNQIIYPENNPGTRSSFSCGQSKQAVSMYHTNHQLRMDKMGVVLVSGQTPLVKSRYLEYINHEGNPYGENAIVAIMCYTGYNVEDAILINEGALKRGLFRTTYYTTYETHEEKSKTGDVVTDKLFSNIQSETNIVGTKPGFDYSQLDKYGLIRENTPVNDKTVLIGMSTSSGATNRVDASKTPKKGQLGIVDKTFVTESEEGKRIAKVRIREERIPNIGDKMASRSGQKGTIGLVIPEQDMPFTRDGIRPDLIINPHAIPTRMTIGQLVECITGKVCCEYGAFGDCTAFENRGSKIRVFGELLPKCGYHSTGNEILYSGMTGEQLEAEIFMGPTYYMRLKHMVKDKINFRARGPNAALTRQPVGGRANDGGLRIGEMERDSVIAHGASGFLKESMMDRGDNYFMAVCNTTGMMAIYNPAKNIFFSPKADGPVKFVSSLDGKEMNIQTVTKFGRSFSVVNVPYSFKLLIQELQAMNLQLRLITEDNIEQLENLAFSHNIDKLLFQPNVSPQDVVQGLHDKIRANRNGPMNVDIPSEEAGPPALEPEFPMGERSPQYPDTSPAYAPSPISKSPDSEVDSYNPFTPPRNFEPRSPSFSPPPIGLQPQSPDFSPPPSPDEDNIQRGGNGDWEPEMNDMVHLRGGSVAPDKHWRVKHKTPHFVTLEDTDGEIHVAPHHEVYPIGDYSFQQMATENKIPFMNETPIMQFAPQPQLVPAFQFSPSIKITTGNDYSNTPITDMPSVTASPEIMVGDNRMNINGPSISNPNPIIIAEKPSDDGVLDFNNLVIVKK